jgi:translation elongation factor EF-Ts
MLLRKKGRRKGSRRKGRKREEGSVATSVLVNRKSSKGT